MSTILGICGVAILGWAGPDFMQPISVEPDQAPEPPAYVRQATIQQTTYVQKTAPRTNAARSVPAMGMASRPRSRMPLPPTDPRALAGDELPLPPTMNGDAVTPNTMRAGPEARFQMTGLGQNGAHRPTTQKPFIQYNPGPTSSPYNLINSSSANGTVNTYMAYVRPAQDQERANQELEQAAGGDDQPAPVYPRVFQNYGTYYPDYSGGR